MKKLIRTLLAKNLLTYITFFALYLYLIYSLDRTPPALMFFVFAYIFLSIIESTYNQNREAKRMGGTRQSARDSIRNVDWFVVISAAVLFIIIYGVFVFLAIRQ